MVEAVSRSLGSHYQLGELLGRGAMGEVYVATDVETGERLAAKLLRADHTDDDEVTARFLQERKLLRELTHPNIVRVRELVVDRDQIGIVMDLIEGEDLRRLLRRSGRLAPHLAVRITIDVLNALSMAHGLEPPVQHRDVKPDNILLADAAASQVYLTDFGVARLAEVGTAANLTKGVGTADYMAPEMTGSVAGAPADVYAVGIMLYELLTGYTPFGRGGLAEVAMRHVTCLPPVPVGIDPTLWANLEALIVKNPASRPSAATAAARFQDLLPGLEDAEPLAPAPVPTQWQQVGVVASVAGEEGQQTFLKGEARASTTGLPVAGLDVAAGVRRDGLLVEDSATMLGSAEALKRDRSAAAPVVQTPIGLEARRRNRTLLIALAVLVVLMLAVAGFVVLRPGHGARPASGSAAVGSLSATVTDPSYAAALELTMSRSAVVQDGTLTVTLSLVNAGAPIKSSLMEVVPNPADPTGPPCARTAQPSWTSESGGPRFSPVPAGVGVPCYTDIQAPSGGFPVGLTELTYTMPWTGGGDDAVTAFLNAEQDQTDQAAPEIGNGITPTYAAQALKRVSMQVNLLGQVPRAQHPLPFSLIAHFRDGVATIYEGGDRAANAFENMGSNLFGRAPTFSCSGGFCASFRSDIPQVQTARTITVTAKLVGYSHDLPAPSAVFRVRL